MKKEIKNIKVKLTRNILIDGEHTPISTKDKPYVKMSKELAIDIVNMKKGEFLDDKEEKKALSKDD